MALQCPTPELSLRRLVNPTERQDEFYEALRDFDFVLYGGEGGGGKSYILRWWLVSYLLWCFKELGLTGVPVGLFCIDYPSLQDRQISCIEAEFPSWLGKLAYRRSVWDFTLRPEYGSGVIRLRNLDKPAKYKSAQFAAIAVEELTEVSLKTFNDLRWRMRWPGIARPKFLGATNPGGVGHTWVKNYWIDRRYPAEFKGKDRYGNPYDITGQFKFVRAKSSDNPHIVESYNTGLLTLPPDMARMVGRGDWNVYTGQYFPQFDPLRHVIKAENAIRQIKPWWTMWLSGDWGFEHPACYYVHAKDEHNRIITFGELWDRRVGEKEWGERITRTWGHLKLKSFPFSFDAGERSKRSDPKYPKSIVQLLTEHLGQKIPRPHPTDNTAGSRMSGFRLMSQLLDADLWQISDACPKLIECLPQLIRDENNQETLLKVDYAEGDSLGDDPADAARYGLQYEYGSSIKGRNVLLEERLLEIRRQFAGKGEDALPGIDPFARFKGRKFD